MLSIDNLKRKVIKKQTRLPRPIKFIILFGAIWLILFIFLPLPPFLLDNYRYIFSSALQVLASMLALIVTVTLLILQLSSDKAPTSLDFFPKKSFFILLIIISTLMLIDGLILTTLPQIISNNLAVSYNSLLYMNALSIIVIASYVFSIVNWMSPKKTIDNLLLKAHQTTTNEERVKIVISLEEMGWNAAQKGYTSIVETVIEAYSKLATVYFEMNPELNEEGKINSNLRHPLREIPRSLERLSDVLLKNDMYRFIYLLARPLIRIAKASNQWSMPPFEMLVSASNILGEYIKRDLQNVYCNFIGEFLYSLEGSDMRLDNLAHVLYNFFQEGLMYKNAAVIGDVLLGFTIIAKRRSDVALKWCNMIVPEYLKVRSLLDYPKKYPGVNPNEMIIELEGLLNINWH